jgi:rhodanese-related sulfurtransferase
MRRTLVVVVALGVVAASLTGIRCTRHSTPVEPSIMPAPTPSTTPLAMAITTAAAFSLIQANQGGPGLVIIDVRTAAEFGGGHLATAINLDYYAADFRSLVGTLDRNTRYLVYCRTGIRGAAATQIMRDIGLALAQNMTGGIDQWILDGYPTVT